MVQKIKVQVLPGSPNLSNKNCYLCTNLHHHLIGYEDQFADIAESMNQRNLSPVKQPLNRNFGPVDEALNSVWARQVPPRVHKIARVLRGS